MEKEVEFDFSKRKDLESNIEPKITEKTKKRMKMAAFLLIGSMSLGVGYNLTTGLMKGYLIEKEANAKVLVEKTKTEEILKQKQNEYNLDLQKKKDAQNAIEDEKQRRINEQEILNVDKNNFNLLLKNKDSLIKNYELQLTIYDKAYQGAVKGVNYGLISLDDLTNIRDLYQDYKKNIHEWINYVNDATSSFSHYQNFSDEMKNELKNELVSYQNGDLKRSTQLESELINTISNDTNDNEEDTALINKRKMARNQMIDDLAKVMSNDNIATTTKKLKR